jgi:membrane protein
MPPPPEDQSEAPLLRALVQRMSRLELLDRSYTLGAQTFVAALPLILVITSAFTGPRTESPVVEEIIERLGLVGAAARAVRDLIVVQSAGVYWLGLIIIAFSVSVLARRASRAYAAIWEVEELPFTQQWRSLVWVALQIGMVTAVAQLRNVQQGAGTWMALLLALAILMAWCAAEYVAQRLFTKGAVPAGRLLRAAAYTSIARAGIGVWATWYIAGSLTRQAETFGPIGVVFSLLAFLVVYWFAVLGGTVLAAVQTGRTGSARNITLP